MSNYLNDKSNNDYQLIHDISEVLRDYKNKNKRVDRKFVDKVVNILLINDDIDVNRTEFVSDGYGCYEFWDKRICINFQRVQRERKYYKQIKSKDGNLFEYFAYLSIILHEFTHAKQYAIIDQGTKYEVGNIYRYSDYFLHKDYNLYLLNHDTIPYERFANLRSDYLTIEALKRVYNIKELWHFQYIFLKELLYDYNKKELYPLKKFNDLVESNSLDNFSSLIPDIDIREDNLYERLNIGLPITEKEFNHLKEIEMNYFTTKKNCQDLNFDLFSALTKKRIKH